MNYKTVIGILFLVGLVSIVWATNNTVVVGSELKHNELELGTLYFSPDLPRELAVQLVAGLFPAAHVQLVLYFMLVLTGVLGAFFLLGRSIVGAVVYLLSPFSLIFHTLPSSELMWLYAFAPWLLFLSVRFGKSLKFRNLFPLLVLLAIALPSYQYTILLILIALGLSISIRFGNFIAFMASMVFAFYWFLTASEKTSRFDLVKEAGELVNPLVGHFSYWQGIPLVVFVVGTLAAISLVVLVFRNTKKWGIIAGILMAVVGIRRDLDLLLIAGSILASISLAYASRGLSLNLDKLIPHNQIPISLVTISVFLLPVLLIALPAFSGSFFYPGLGVEIPKQYYEASQFIKANSNIGYVASGDWDYYNWGYQGFGIWRYSPKVTRLVASELNTFLVSGGIIISDESSLDYSQQETEGLSLIENFDGIKFFRR